MKNKLRLLFIVFILTAYFHPASFADYAHLVGKRVKINGPAWWSNLGVALTEGECNKLIVASYYEDRKALKAVLESFDIMRVKNHVSAIVVDTKIFEAKAKVILLRGLYKGMSGWVPIAWLDFNDERPDFSTEPEEKDVL